MASGLPARRRVLIAGACAALAALLGGCTAASNSSVTVSGATLEIYASVPSQDPAAADVYDAEQLALTQVGDHIGNFTVQLAKLTGNKLSDNARAAIQDTKAIAYLGELEPGQSAGTIGITNALDVLQVSPTDTAQALTQPTAAVPGAPGSYYESQSTYGKTFARVAPNGTQEAHALLAEMTALGVKQLYVSADSSDYGKALALEVRRAAPAAGITITSSPTGAGGYLYAASSQSAATAASALANAAKSNPQLKLFVPDALDTSAFASSFGPANLTLYGAAPGFLTKDLPPAGQQFVSQFKSAYGHDPAAQAIFGYTAVQAVLQAMKSAGSGANDRTDVVKDFFTIKDLDTPIGTLSIDSVGDPDLAPFVISKFKDGSFVPFAAQQG